MKELIELFYTSFINKDVEQMVNCYHSEIEFEDPAFGKLIGKRAKNMWRMLLSNSKDLEVNYSNVEIVDGIGKAQWIAKYTFSKTGKQVVNIIDCKFEFKDGLIIKHTDFFDLHKWAKQALGFKGFILGGTTIFKKKLNNQTNQLLDRFEKNK